MLRHPVPLALAVVLATAVAGCSAGEVPQPVGEPVAVAASAGPERGREPVRTPLEPSPGVTAEPSSTATAPSATDAVSPAAPIVDVSAVQRTLTDLRYYVGPLDGRAGPAMTSAVMAFQKVNGLSVDGRVGPVTLAALAAPKAPTLRASSPADRVEVDLDQQVLYVVKSGAVARILPVSSGNGATYRQKSGGTARALTPTGWYTIERRIVGERRAALGTLYDPQYFYRGWAIHGSDSVPAGPASHGCVRVTRPDAKWLLGQIGNGTPVYLYGGRHVFRAGSGAPGTDDPNGDVAAAPAAAPAPAPAAPAPAPAAAAPAAPPAAEPRSSSAPPAPATTPPAPPASEPPAPPTVTPTAVTSTLETP